MQKERGKLHCGKYAYLIGEARYYLVLCGLALMVPLSLALLLWLLPTANAADNRQVEGANGVLEVRGVLTESACRLEMESARQDIELGDIATGQLMRPGDRGVPAAMQLRLRDCLRSPARSLDERTGARYWARDQPAVRVGFHAPADADNPQLVKVVGASGLGLRLLDDQGEDVRLGGRGAPVLLAPGNDALNFSIVAERTGAELVSGAYRATVDFNLSYE